MHGKIAIVTGASSGIGLATATRLASLGVRVAVVARREALLADVMLLSGANPVYASICQFVTPAMILASSGLTSLVGTLLIRPRIFSEADQLLLRPAA